MKSPHLKGVKTWPRKQPVITRKQLEHLEQAAREHREAAKQHLEGQHEKAAHHAVLAYTHALQAKEHKQNAFMEHLKAHGTK